MTKDLALDFEYKALPDEKEPNKFIKLATKFFYSYWYLLVCGIAVTIAWYVNIPDIAFAVLCLLIGVCLIVLDDITPVLAPIFMLPTSFPTNATPESSMILIVYLIPVVIGVVYHLIKCAPRKKLGKWFWPQVAVTIALIMGGLGSNITPDRYIVGLPQGLGMGLGSLAVYFLCVNYCKTDNYDFKLYFSKMMTSVGVLYAFQVFLLMFANPNGFAFHEITHAMIDVGAVKSNALSHVMLMTMPFIVYHAMRQPKTMIIHILLSFFVCACSALTYSRGCLLLLIVLAPMTYIASAVYEKKHRGKMYTMYSLAIIAVIALLIVMRDDIGAIIQKILRVSSDASLDEFSSGRVTLYREARLLFQSYPLFGVSLGYTSPTSQYFPSTIDFFWFHSTFWHVLAGMGLFGFAMYIYNYYVRYKMVFVNIKQNFFNYFVFMSFFAFDSYSLIDANSFLPMPFLFMVAAITAFLEKSNDQDVMDKEKLKYEKYNYINN